jgi:hypothetical protein
VLEEKEEEKAKAKERWTCQRFAGRHNNAVVVFRQHLYERYWRNKKNEKMASHAMKYSTMLTS